MNSTENQNPNTQIQTSGNTKNLATTDLGQKKPRKALFIIITTIVFIMAEIGRFSSMGWGFFFTPGFAVLFLASCGCFIAFKNKQAIDYIIYTIICILYLIWGYTWIDIVDYGPPSNFLTNLTGIDYSISSNISISVMAICSILEIIPIVRIVTKSRPRQDLGLPWDKHRNLELGVVAGIAIISTLIIFIQSLICSTFNILIIFSINNAVFVWGGICFANIKQKKKFDYWLFCALCLSLVASCLSFIFGNLANSLYAFALHLMMLGTIVSILIAVRRHFDKYEPRQNSSNTQNISAKF